MKIDYPTGTIKKASLNENSIEFTENQLFNLKEKSLSTAIRNCHNFEDKAFFLSSYYNWIIIRDNSGSICLVPFKK